VIKMEDSQKMIQFIKDEIRAVQWVWGLGKQLKI